MPEDTDVGLRKPALPLFFLKKEDEWRFEIKKVEAADYKEIQKRIENGESVLIGHDQNGKTISIYERAFRERFKKSAAEPWYFTHE